MVAQEISCGLGGCSAYSPKSLVLKLLPTSPMKVRYFPAAFAQEAVAVLPTLTQVMEGQGIDVIDVMSTRRILKENMMC